VKYRYSKYTGDPLDEIDLEDLVEKLSDLLLSSGFHSPFGSSMYGESEDDRTMQALHDAIMDALFNGGVLSEETLERLMGDPADADQADARSRLEQLIQDIIDRMMQEGFITGAPDLEPEKPTGARRAPAAAWAGRAAEPLRGDRQEPGFSRLPRAARPARLARQEQPRAPRYARPRHRIETIAAPKPYEFGDSLNLDPSSTVLNAVQRIGRERREKGEALGVLESIDISHEDLMWRRASIKVRARPC